MRKGTGFMELWDAYTREEELTGLTLVRGEEIPKGLFHLVCDVLVRHIDGSYLCMKRSMLKPTYGGWYETSAGGSALAGENCLQCAARELKEETGIEANEFRQIGRFVREENQAIYYTFLCVVGCDKDSIQLQPGETEGYRWMSEQEFIEFVNSDEMIPSNRFRYEPYLKQMGYV